SPLSLCSLPSLCFSFPAPSPPPLYTLSLHDALPISSWPSHLSCAPPPWGMLTAVDMALGSIRWQVPLGSMQAFAPGHPQVPPGSDRKSTRLNSSHVSISYAVFCLKKKIKNKHDQPTH